MNIRKNIDYSAMHAALDAAISRYQMITPLCSSADILQEKIFTGCYNTSDEFYA